MYLRRIEGTFSFPFGAPLRAHVPEPPAQDPPVPPSGPPEIPDREIDLPPREDQEDIREPRH